MRSFTPAPLDFTQAYTGSANGGCHIYLTDSTGRKIAALWGGGEEKVANARLFSAAPDLIEALQKLSDVCEMTTFSDQYPYECELARAAITKATAERKSNG